MNVTRNVITDLLPVYFSGEASDDTKLLVEDYFREDPDFERIARRAATQLETLRTTATVPLGAEKEKRDLQLARDAVTRLAFARSTLRGWLFYGGLLFLLTFLAYLILVTRH
jgi:hypothetical protein